MKKLLLLTLVLFSLKGIAQVPFYPPIGSPVGNTMQGVWTKGFIRLPHGTNPTLNGAIDSSGYLYYNTIDHNVYKYDGNGVWASPVRIAVRS